MKEKVSALIFIIFSTLLNSVNANENLKFSGSLVALPCTIPESEQQISVHFGEVSMRDLYSNRPMIRVPFDIHLIDCDPTTAGKVSITFVGLEDPELPGLLGLKLNQSAASGVAIGLESEKGKKILLNKSMPAYDLNRGENDLMFKAYIAAEPDKVARHSIQTGYFNAMAVMVLKYD